MIKISGFVLLKETNAGIPNLVVRAFNSHKPLHEIIEEHKTEKGFAPTLMQHFELPIASAITDINGKFIFNNDDLSFEGNESRPDLIVTVSAPEDIVDINIPMPLPPEKRILYLSAGSRHKAGAEEVYVIRLLKEQLIKFNIPATASINTSEEHSNILVSNAQNAWDFKDNLKEKFKERLQFDHEKATHFKNMAKEKVKNLSAIPLHLREGGLKNNDLLINNKKELNEKLKPAQDKAVADGLKRMEQNKSKARLRLVLTKDELAGIGLKVDRKGNFTGKIDPQKLADTVRSLNKGVDLIRVKGLNNSSPDELEKKYLLKKVKNNINNNHQGK